MNNMFSPISDRITVVRIKDKPLTESEIVEVTKQLIFSESKIEEPLKDGSSLFNESEIGLLLSEEFKNYIITEDPLTLEEDALNEGKIINAIRWKLAKFSLRFLKESSINDFFMAYYSNEKGEPTQKGKEYCKKSKKEKVKRMRELAEEMKQSDKDKVINSKAAEEAEKKGAGALVGAALSGAVGAIAGANANKLASVKADGIDSTELDLSLTTELRSRGYGVGEVKGITKNNDFRDAQSMLSQKALLTTDYNTKNGGNGYFSTHEINTYDGTAGQNHNGVKGYFSATAVSRIGAPVMALLASVASVLFGAMWGGIILAGVNTVRGIMAFHKANVMRADEIMKELKIKKE